MPRNRPVFFFSLALLLIVGQTSFAQDSGRFVRWTYQDATHILAHQMPAVVLMGVGGAAFAVAGMQVDDDVLGEVQNTFSGEELFLDITNELGNPLTLGAPLILFGAATAIHNPRLQDASFTSIQSVLYAGFVTRVLKEVIGRYRPEEDRGPKEFEPFSGNGSLPSGHATIAFAILTPWAYYYPHPATFALVALGAGTAVSRMALDRHFATDVIIGGSIGFLMARYLSKRHLNPTNKQSAMTISPLVGPQVAGLHASLHF